MNRIARNVPTTSSQRTMFLALLLLLPACCSASRSVNYTLKRVAGISAHVVTVDLNNANVRVSPAIARRGIGSAESWSSMISRTHPTAAVTGTFFSTRTNYLTGDLVVEGQLMCRGRVGTAVCIGWDNSVAFSRIKKGVCNDWSGCRSVIVAGPILVWDGKKCVVAREQGFKDPRLFAMNARTGVGVTRSGKLLLVAVTKPVYLGQLARVMKGLGAVKAAALDGGGSTGLYYRGKSIAKPRRSLTNLLVAYDDASVYRRVRGRLASSGSRIAGATSVRIR